MRRPFGFGCVGLFGVVLASYGAGLGRYFTSEDFLLVRFLGENPPWRDPDLWTGPWLGITVVKFYRPVSTLLYGLEIAAFGASPFGYNVLHTLVHALNVVMIFAIVRRLASGVWTAFAAAALFALYPLHPNAVLFGASFAALYGAAFMFAALLAYQRFRETERRRWWGACLACFLLALGSYEAAAVLPALLAAYDGLLGRRGAGPRWEKGLALVPFFAVLGPYILLRRAIFGRFVGGYDESSTRLLDLEWRVLLQDFAMSIQKLHVPTFDRWPTLAESLLFTGLATVVPFAVLFLLRRPTGGGSLRPWFFAWGWIVIGLTPFAFRPCVPGNGRYWYVAAAGVAMAAAFLARGIAHAAVGRWRFVPAAALVGAGFYWGWLLAGNLAVYADAGRSAQTIQAELIREHAAAGAPPRTFVTRYPYFLVNRSQVPVAQVFHYGLRDAVNRPFVRASVPVFPLPPLRDVERLPIFVADPRAAILEWDTAAGTFRRVTGSPGLAGSPAEITVRAPADGAVLDPGELEVEFVPGEFGPWRLTIVAPGNATTTSPTPVRQRGETARLALSAEFVTTMGRLYDGAEFLWWLEARDGSGDPAAFSRMRSFRLAPRR